jgi:hypothetical protein
MKEKMQQAALTLFNKLALIFPAEILRGYTEEDYVSECVQVGNMLRIRFTGPRTMMLQALDGEGEWFDLSRVNSFEEIKDNLMIEALALIGAGINPEVLNVKVTAQSRNSMEYSKNVIEFRKETVIPKILSPHLLEMPKIGERYKVMHYWRTADKRILSMLEGSTPYSSKLFRTDTPLMEVAQKIFGDIPTVHLSEQSCNKVTIYLKAIIEDRASLLHSGVYLHEKYTISNGRVTKMYAIVNSGMQPVFGEAEFIKLVGKTLQSKAELEPLDEGQTIDGGSYVVLDLGYESKSANGTLDYLNLWRQQIEYVDVAHTLRLLRDKVDHIEIVPLTVLKTPDGGFGSLLPGFDIPVPHAFFKPVTKFVMVGVRKGRSESERQVEGCGV